MRLEVGRSWQLDRPTLYALLHYHLPTLLPPLSDCFAVAGRDSVDLKGW